MILEICASTIESGLNAQNARADRIELCTHLDVGGLTPSYGMIKVAMELIDIPVHVLIRPRSGNFEYSVMELEIMKEDIDFCKKQGCAGVVIGLLNQDKTINTTWFQMLLQEAGKMEVTFHRAFDQVPNQFNAVDELIALGVTRILTSGNADSAIQGKDQLRQLVEYCDKKITIMPGGGVRPENISSLLETGAMDYHSSALDGKSLHSNRAMVKALRAVLS